MPPLAYANLTAPLFKERHSEKVAVSCENLAHFSLSARQDHEVTNRDFDSPKKQAKENFWENVKRVEERKIPTKPPIFNNTVFVSPKPPVYLILITNPHQVRPKM